MQIVIHKCGQIIPKMFVEHVFVQAGGIATDGQLQTTHKSLLLKCGWASEI